VIWQRYATSAQLRFINEHILLLLREHGFQRILSDHSELQTIHADDQKWIIESWLPRAVDAGLRAAAAKKSVHHFGQLAVDLIRRSVQREIALRSFDTIDEAREWLRTAG
jgi:hypothetical protein